MYNCDPAYNYVEDTELWTRALAAKKRMANIAEFHYQFLVTGGTFAVGRRRGFRYAACEAGLGSGTVADRVTDTLLLLAICRVRRQAFSRVGLADAVSIALMLIQRACAGSSPTKGSTFSQIS